MTEVQVSMFRESPMPKSHWRIGHWLLISSLVIAHWSFSAEPPKIDDETATKIEALNRLKGVDLESKAALKGAVLKILEKTRGTPQFVEIVRDFKLTGHGQALLNYAVKYPNESSGIEAFR